ncbi:MAG TPA: fused isobutyryl-CoA mutase/GTPase IcmF [Burkholderiales bacterium]|nr:fused isobutyryl-CoA mutase/GTPase IcmF [Burkholderiales bacterium]
MTDLSESKSLRYKAKHKIRFVTAASLFDGHDASINIMRRILQASGAEVIHLGHNRSVDEVVNAALQEDVQGIAISSYQGGHIEYFKYMVDLLRKRDGNPGGGTRIQIFGGGGGVIVAEEIKELQDYGVARIYTPEDGQKMGLQGMINDMLARCDFSPVEQPPTELKPGDFRALARVISAFELGVLDEKFKKQIQAKAGKHPAPVLGITGTGGSGKSSLTDELVRRFRLDQGDRLKIAVLAVDPSRRKTGGALLGDRIRMNAIHAPGIFMRSLATRASGAEIAACLPDAIAAARAAEFDLVIVETSGIGQGDAAIVKHVDCSLYVMTPEFGAASQLEKIDMLDFADFVAINKFDRRGAEDALRDVRKQMQRNRESFAQGPEQMPVYGTIAARFNDDGVTALYQGVAAKLAEKGLRLSAGKLPPVKGRTPSLVQVVLPPKRARYLAEISETVRDYHRHAEAQARVARERQQLTAAKAMLGKAAPAEFKSLIEQKDAALDARSKKLLQGWPDAVKAYAGDEQVVTVRGKELRTRLNSLSLSGTKVPKVALPRYEDAGEILRWRLRENLPGEFPFTAGVFSFKRENEDPTRMFAGEGDPFRTNRRFHLLSKDMPAKRLSTAFDSVTLYGFDPDERPDIYGKVGNSGVSIATLDDMKALYAGFDLCSPQTSVSMTINGPAPTILAMFFNTAIDQQIEKLGRESTGKELSEIKAKTLSAVRGTVQADILKEDQGQNTCIFSTEFSLKVMGDIQQYFIAHKVKNFYSVSISGYHIAEAGANPISQLAFTLANGFTFVETYLARGMAVDDFAPNLSFFFSYGMDPEYTVLGRVARRIWAVAMERRYGANDRSQRLKFHSQTSGRSLHAQEIAFNDIRTTLQALASTYDNTNSLHTNAYDEAITTPTEESVRRAMAIQLILNREWGLAKNENPNQGSFIIDELTDLVEEAVLKEFESISARGGVLGAMETGYQRGKIQEESMLYEHRKHDGSYPIVGVNTFRNPSGDSTPPKIELIRSSGDEKQSQLKRLRDFQRRNAQAAPAMLERLRAAVVKNENVFEVLMDAVRVCSLGQITHELFDVGGQYRRSM